MQNKKFDLEDRFINYTCHMMDVLEALPSTRSGNFMAGQLTTTSPAPVFMYAQTQAAASAKDFIQKMEAVLLALKECRLTLQLITKKELVNPASRLDDAYKETEALIAITGKSISTARKNSVKTAKA